MNAVGSINWVEWRILLSSQQFVGQLPEGSVRRWGFHAVDKTKLNDINRPNMNSLIG